MKKKYTLTICQAPLIRALIFCFLLLSLHGNAQNEFAPFGAKWTYADFFPGVFHKATIHEVTGDTIIAGKVCKILKSEIITANGIFPMEDIILYINGDTVRHFSDGEFYILYNFSADIGDSWEIKIGDDFTTAKVEAVDSILVASDFLKRQFISFAVNDTIPCCLGSWGYGTVIEKIGASGTFLPFFTSDIDSQKFLHCYEDPFLSFTNPNPLLDFPCGFVTPVFEREQQNVEWKVFPNPAQHQTVFHYRLPEKQEKAKLVITSLDGRMVETMDIEYHSGQIVWSTKGVKNGIYLFSLLIDGKVFKSERLVISK